MDELKANAISHISILEASRLSKKEETGNLVPLKSVLVTFDGQLLPQDIKFYYNIYKVSPYVLPPKLCYGCARHGHVKTQCKNPRCLFCGEKPHEDQNCPNGISSPLCINCKGSHWAVDKQFPLYVDEKEIRRISALHDVRVKKAAFLYKREKSSHQGSQNIDSAIAAHFNSSLDFSSPLFNFSNFPSLGEADVDSITFGPEFSQKYSQADKKGPSHSRTTTPLSPPSSHVSQETKKQKDSPTDSPEDKFRNNKSASSEPRQSSKYNSGPGNDFQDGCFP
ncbi:uncharacterized protein LOC117170767 [Belonocnema kinseyi]|uniref:uncharacterized protein LOC117170767 n=1 Tax=Belonocnema kinseyi TaxID=2817044 RepID=UPI00143CF3B9|nr:uncharacterized protein LOC117170767 [Belonocnema kinseyi]